jgi:hypothetical protein
MGTWIQHGIAAAITLGAAVWLIRRAASKKNGEGPCASCGLQRTMKRPAGHAGPDEVALPTRRQTS